MKDKIKICELEGFQTTFVEKSEPSAKRYYDLTLLPTESLRLEMREFLQERSKQVSLKTICGEITRFKELCRFLEKQNICFTSFENSNLESLILECKRFLMKNGESFRKARKRAYREGEFSKENPIIPYIRRIHEYFNPRKDTFSFESDCWMLDTLGFDVKQNPSKLAKSINFNNIYQDELKEEIKKVIYRDLKSKAVGTIQMQISAVRDLSKFLDKKYPNVHSVNELTPEVIGSYIEYLHLNEEKNKSHDKRLVHIKMMIQKVELIYDYDGVSNEFNRYDLLDHFEKNVDLYSEAELARFNEALKTIDIQIARVVKLKQLIPPRIGDLLSLKADNLIQKGEKTLIRYTQAKTRKKHVLEINENVRRLIEKALLFSRELHPGTDFVFVNEKDPNRSMQESVVYYHLNKMIHEQNLVRDNGDSFKVSTHIFRNQLASELANVGYKDLEIAKVMGHSGTKSIPSYRRVDVNVLRKETEIERTRLVNLVEKNRKGW